MANLGLKPGSCATLKRGVMNNPALDCAHIML